MKVCILCEDSKVEIARDKATGVFPEKIESLRAMLPANMVPEHLSIPVSESGELPATHWFCFATISEETYQNMLARQEHTVIEESRPTAFLEKHGLKRIKNKQ